MQVQLSHVGISNFFGRLLYRSLSTQLHLSPVRALQRCKVPCFQISSDQGFQHAIYPGCHGGTIDRCVRVITLGIIQVLNELHSVVDLTTLAKVHIPSSTYISAQAPSPLLIVSGQQAVVEACNSRVGRPTRATSDLEVRQYMALFGLYSRS
jgi:hypothetical protein